MERDNAPLSRDPRSAFERLMPDHRSHRGPHPEDAELFSEVVWPRLQQATDDFSLLLTRGYAQPSAIKLVGDRYELNQRQRMAVVRCACSDAALELRRSKEVDPDQLNAGSLWIDGLNLLTTIEVALGGGVILLARDGCYRDIASVHGTYRKVEETRPAIETVGQFLQSMQLRQCIWLLDAPVGNSGRLAQVLLEAAKAHGWNWQVDVVPNPDARLAESNEIVATADSIILDRCAAWWNAARRVIDVMLPHARIVPMSARRFGRPESP